MQRTRAIIAAAIAAIVTGGLLFVYVQGATERAAEGESPVSVLVASQPIAASTPFDQAYNSGAIGPVKMPKRLVPPTAVFNPNDASGRFSTGLIAVGQVIVKESFAKAEDLKAGGFGASALARRIPDGRVAVTFSAGGQAAVAGLIQPGDHVNLLIQVPDAKVLGLPTTNGPAVIHVFQNLEVFALGTTAVADPKATPAAGSSTAAATPVVASTLYTVLVDPKDSARLVLLTTQYPVTLGLVNPTFTPRDVPPVNNIGALPDGLTPDLSAGKR